MAYTNSSNFAKKFCAKSPFKQNGPGGLRKDKVKAVKNVENPEYLIKSKTKTIDSEGNVKKTKISKGGYNVKEKTISEDGMTYTKTKKRGGTTKTKQGKTFKGHISDLFGGGKNNQYLVDSKPQPQNDTTK